MTTDRLAARRAMPVRLYQLGEEPGDDLAGQTNVAERLAMVALLTQRMWLFTGRPLPVYTRANIPCNVIRPK